MQSKIYLFHLNKDRMSKIYALGTNMFYNHWGTLKRNNIERSWKKKHFMHFSLLFLGYQSCSTGQR